MVSILSINSGPNISISISAKSQQYCISSLAYLKFRGTTTQPAFRIPKYMGSHSMQFIISIPILVPLLTFLVSRKLPILLAIRSNLRHVMERRYGISGSANSIRLASRQVWALSLSSVGLISTSASPEGL